MGVLADDRYARVITDSLDKIGVEYGHCVTLHGETGRCSCRLVSEERVLGDENDGGLVKSDPLVLTDELLEFLKGLDAVHTSCYSYIGDQHSDQLSAETQRKTRRTLRTFLRVFIAAGLRTESAFFIPA